MRNSLEKTISSTNFDTLELEELLKRTNYHLKNSPTLAITYFQEALGEFYNCETKSQFNKYSKIFLDIIINSKIDFIIKKEIFNDYKTTIKEIKEKPIPIY